ncbi:hypothetical protein SpCBS45565_g03990 [Spizellomyces sp. 'palustris']|nr:hypothetical protein SpCBS45565_g03990 [Spizellomyces sp. 'palustris']
MADTGYRPREPPRILNRNANGFFDPAAADPPPPTPESGRSRENIYPSAAARIPTSRSKSRTRDPNNPNSPLYSPNSPISPLPMPSRYYQSSSTGSSPPRSRRPSEDSYANGNRRPPPEGVVSVFENDRERRRPSGDSGSSRSSPNSSRRPSLSGDHPPRNGSLLRSGSGASIGSRSGSDEQLLRSTTTKSSTRNYGERERDYDSGPSRSFTTREPREGERGREREAERSRTRESPRNRASERVPDKPSRLAAPSNRHTTEPAPASASASFDDMLKALDDLHTKTAANPPRSSPLPAMPPEAVNDRGSDRPNSGRGSKDYELMTASLDQLIDNTRKSVPSSSTGTFGREAERRERDRQRAKEKDLEFQREKEREKELEREREVDKEREKERARDKIREKEREKERGKQRERDDILAAEQAGAEKTAQADRLEAREVQRKRKEQERIEAERRDADRRELQMIAEARQREMAADRQRDATRIREPDARADESIIVRDYVSALMMTLRADTSYPNPDDFATPDGYAIWEDTLGMSYSEVLCELLRARFIDKKGKQEKKEKPQESTVVQLFFKIVEARGLVAKEGRSRDPYCTIEHGNIPDDGTEEARKADKERKDKEVLQTDTIKGTTNPRWNEHVNIPARALTDKVMVSVYDRAKEQFLGRVKIPFSELIPIAARDGYVKKWFRMTGLGKKEKDKYVGGEILIEAAIKDDGSAGPSAKRPKQDPIAALQSAISATDLDLRALYRTLLRACLILDMNMLGKQINEKTQRLLSEESKALLTILGRTWGLSEAFMVMTYLQLLFEKYKVYEIPQSALLDAFETLKEDLKKRGWLSEYERPAVLELLADMDEYYRTQITKYKEFFPENKPKQALATTILMLRMIFKNPLYRQSHPDKPESFRDELRGMLTEAAIARYEKLKELTTPFDTNDLEAVIEGINKLAEMVSEEIEADGKWYRKPFEKELDIVRLTAENYLKYFVLTLESASEEIASDVAVKSASKSVFELYKRVRVMDERYAKMVPGLKRMSMNAGFNVERWFAPFVQKWLEHLSDRTLEWVSNAVKADNFEPLVDGVGQGQHHSSSVTDLFSAVYQELAFINDLGWSDRVQNAGFMQGFAKAIEQYCDAIALGEIKADLAGTAWQGLLATAANVGAIGGKFGANGPRDIANESCVKLCNIEYAMSKLDDMYRVMNVQELTSIIRRHRAAMAAENGSSAVSSEDNEMTVKGAFKIQLSYAENLKPCNKNGLANPYCIVRVPDGTVVPVEEPPSMSPSSMRASSTSSSARTSTGSSSAGPTVLSGIQCELARSRAVSDTINPTWDETFQVILPPVTKLEVAVLSKNMLTADEIAGKAVVDLSRGTRLRRKLGDHQTHDVYVEMEPQGRVLVRFTMEGADEDVDFWFRRSKEKLGRTRDDFVRALTGKIIPYAREEILKIIKSHEAAPLPSKSFFSSLTTAVQYSDKTASGASIDERVSVQDADAALEPLTEYLNKNLGTLADYLSERMAQEVIRRCWDEVVSIIEWSLIPPLYGPIERDRRVLNKRQTSTATSILRILKEFFYADGQGVPLRMLETRKHKYLESLLDQYHADIGRLKREYELDLLKGRDREVILRLVRVKVEKELDGTSANEEREEGRKWIETQLARRKELVRR